MDPVVTAVLRAALALLFVVAASHKARDLKAFRATLADYRLLPESVTAVVTPLVVGAEIGIAAVLALPGPRAPGPVLAAALLAVYSLAIAINLLRGRRHIDCGCTGPVRRHTLSGWLVARNGVLIVAALSSLFPPRPRGLVWVDGLTLVGAVSALAALYAALDRLFANASLRVRLERA